MNTDALFQQSLSCLDVLCGKISDRSVGSSGNREATSFFRREAAALGWEMDSQEFDAMDWVDGGARLDVDEKKFEVHVSPYSPGCGLPGDLAAVSTIDELKRCNLENRIAVLHGDLAREQLLPLQGDHSIFIQNGVPALAVSSEWFTPKIDFQTTAHTRKDNIKIVDPVKLVEIARFLKEIVTDFGG